MEYRVEALTEIWTGDINCQNTSLRNTGLIGSIRWWFEVLVRGLGGYACDPSGEAGKEYRCPDTSNRKTWETPGHRCVVCELFGCTGWARKFRFEVRKINGDIFSSILQPNNKNNEAIFHFLELREIKPEEKMLLELTMRLISEFGAIGGKTVLKPSKQNTRSCHRDYGLVEIVNNESEMEIDKNKILQYLISDQWLRLPKNDQFEWASLDNFWAIQGKYLYRKSDTESSFNQVIGRPPEKWNAKRGNSWLSGCNKPVESKKVFSFAYNKGRTFGFAQPDAKSPYSMANIKANLVKVFGSGVSILEKDDILKQILDGGESS